MGLYGSPDVGNLYTEKKEKKKTKGEGYKLQTNKIVWLVIAVMNIGLFLMVGRTINDLLGILGLDCVVIFGLSIVNLIYNIIKNNKIKRDILFLIFSFILFIALGGLMN